MNIITRSLSAALCCLGLLSTTAAQNMDPCALNVGVNLAGISDWSSELPFVDMMKMARTWGTRNSVFVEGGTNPWDTEVIDQVPLNAQGYPLVVPIFIPGLGLETTQAVFTVWACSEAWPTGNYTFLYDGTGTFEWWGDAEMVNAQPGQQVVSIDVVGQVIRLSILSSDVNDPVRNFRLIMPGHANTYQTQPYNPLWLERLAPFSTLRFMDWGSTNNWSFDNAWLAYDEPSDTTRAPWTSRARTDQYTWSSNRGVPYEVMVDVCNTLQKDLWICVPFIASNDYIAQMAALVRDQLDPDLQIYVEYSNENWNWMFGQTQWLNQFGCVDQGVSWPEGIVPYIQNTLDIWTSAFAGQMDRLTRVVGVQAAWQDVSNRIVNNMQPGTFDAFSPASYFGLTQEGDAALDALGANATVADLLPYVEDAQRESMNWLRDQKESIADPLGISMIYYEGGQHITPDPFGDEPTYAQALIDIQRDPAMRTLYDNWNDSLRTLVEPGETTRYMHFSFVAGRSARYGSWGLLEALDQDTSVIPAPKYASVIALIAECTDMTTGLNDVEEAAPSAATWVVQVGDRLPTLQASDLLWLDVTGRTVYSTREASPTIPSLPPGLYLLRAFNGTLEHRIIIP